MRHWKEYKTLTSINDLDLLHKLLYDAQWENDMARAKHIALIADCKELSAEVTRLRLSLLQMRAERDEARAKLAEWQPAARTSDKFEAEIQEIYREEA